MKKRKKEERTKKNPKKKEVKWKTTESIYIRGLLVYRNSQSDMHQYR